MSFTGLSRATMRRFLRLRTDMEREYRHFDAKNRLEILAVRFGLKPAFLGVGEAGAPLKHAARLLHLNYQFTGIPPPYFSRKPKVENSFLSAFIRTLQREEIVWIYSDAQIEPKISACLAGELNEGYVLGYPQCCIRWHEENRVLEVESKFEDIESYIAQTPAVLAQHRKKDAAYEALMDSIEGRSSEKVFNSIDEHIMETYRRYPFVPHWACSQCLEGASNETERLNRQYQELVMRLSPDLASEIIHSLSKVIAAKDKSSSV
jgi:hypothetical protein